MHKIAQIGTFDVENFGDLLFPDILKYYSKGEYEIDLYSPKGGIKCFDDKEVLPISTLSSNIKKYDAILIGGGDLIRTDSKINIRNDIYGYTSKPSLELWAYPIMIAKKNNIPVILNAVGVTHDFELDEVALVKKILSYVDYFCVRDTEAQRTLERIGIFDSVLIPDTVLSISKFLKKEQLNEVYDNLLKEKLVPEIDEYIIIQHNSTNVDNYKYYDDLINFIRHVSKKHKILLMPIGYIHDDYKVLSKIYSEKIDNVYIVDSKRKLTPIEMISIIFNSYGYIGTSMHGGVVSSSFNKKIMFLNSMNSKKLHGFSNVINKSNLDVNDSKNLIYAYDTFFENQEKININEYIKNIDNHFKNIYKIISNHKKQVDENFVDLSSYIHYFYEQKNSRLLIGQYYIDNHYLDRMIFEYEFNDNLYTYVINSDKDCIINLYPSVNRFIYINNIEVNSNVFSLDNHYFNSGVYIRVQIHKGKNIITICLNRFITEFEISNSFKSLDDYSYLEKQITSIEEGYIELESKYCELLRK